MEKQYDDLVFTDDFLFCKILTDDPELCKEFTELIIGRKINRIVSPLKQKPVKVTRGGRGIRLDVCFEDDLNNIYDIEMQTTHKSDLPKRVRYYQGLIDLDMLREGRPFNDLKNSYIIFLCTFDPFGEKKHRYSFSTICEENTSIQLNDGTHKIFISTEGTENDVSPELKALLNYMKGDSAKTEIAQRIDQAVLNAKNKKNWRKSYMTLFLKLQEKYQDGREDEKKRLSLLVQKIINAGRNDELGKILTDTEALEKAYSEFGIPTDTDVSPVNL